MPYRASEQRCPQTNKKIWIKSEAKDYVIRHNLTWDPLGAMAAYRCRFCHETHVGHIKKKPDVIKAIRQTYEYTEKREQDQVRLPDLNAGLKFKRANRLAQRRAYKRP